MLDAPLNHIIQERDGSKFVQLENTVGQRWYFPCKNMRQYMSLFQPSSLKGSTVALLLPWLSYFPWLLKFISARIVHLKFDEQFIAILQSALGIENITCSIFCGSPGRHKKPTIMLVAEGRTIGYCKITDNPEVIELFKREEETLNYLNSAGVKYIPTIVYCNQLNESKNTWLMVQTTERITNEKAALPTDPKVKSFVQQMMDATCRKMRYEESEYAHTISSLKKLISLLEIKEWIKIVQKNIALVEDNLKGKDVNFSAFHGDLTPWNSFIVNDHLYAFDFEYFKKSFPLYADYFHYFTQSEIYDKYADGKQIVKKYNYLKTEILADVCNSDFLYRCYLLAIMEFYLNRDRGFLNSRLKEIFETWIYILTHI